MSDETVADAGQPREDGTVPGATTAVAQAKDGRRSKGMMAVAVIAVIVSCATAIGVGLRRTWATGFAAVTLGDSRSRVYDLMGGSGHPHGCRDRKALHVIRAREDRCRVAATYQLPIASSFWTIEFDVDGKVIDKQYWPHD